MVRVASGGKRGTAVHRGLLADPKIRAWYEERALRSKLSADTYLRQLGGSLARLRMGPSEFIELAKSDPDALGESLVTYAAGLKRDGRLDSYIAKTFDGLRSWLRYRRVDFDGFPKLSPARGVTLERERVPTQDELRRVLARLGPRGRVVALLMAHSGLRPGVMGGYGATDGLRLGDLPELKLGKRPALKIIPFVIRVPARLSKTRKMYTTFGSQELASALLGYLDDRSSRGERLGSESPVITVDSFAATHEFQGKKGIGRFLTTKGLIFEIRAALSDAQPNGVTWRPYVLRSYCSTRLLLAEGQGKIGRDLREAILGHDGGVSARYNVGKVWGEELLQEAREAYQRCELFLSTQKVTRQPDEVELKRAILGVFLPEDEVAKLDVTRISSDEVRKLVTDRVRGSGADSVPRQHAVPTQQPRHNEAGGLEFACRLESVVPLDEVKLRLTEGWTWVASLGNGEAIIRRPH